MKKFIALGVAVMMLLLGFVASVDVAVAKNEVSVCEDLKPSGNTHNGPNFV